MVYDVGSAILVNIIHNNKIRMKAQSQIIIVIIIKIIPYEVLPANHLSGLFLTLYQPPTIHRQDSTSQNIVPAMTISPKPYFPIRVQGTIISSIYQ